MEKQGDALYKWLKKKKIASNKSWFKRHYILTAIIIVFGLIFLVAIFSGKGSSNPKKAMFPCFDSC